MGTEAEVNLLAESPAYNNFEVAKYFVAKACDYGVSLNQTKLQKLLFMVFGFYICEAGKPLFNEMPRLWPFGPVFPAIRQKISFNSRFNLGDFKYSELSKDTILNNLVDKILTKYSPYTAKQLSDWSHGPGTPWSLIAEETNQKWNTQIPIEYIRDYFCGYEA